MSTIKAKISNISIPRKVSATISGSASTYIPPFIQNHIDCTTNPHQVSCSQIGAMPYDENIVSDATYVHTDNNFDDEYKAKLDSIELGSISSSNIFSDEYKAAIDNLPNDYTNNRNIADNNLGCITGNDISSHSIVNNNYIQDGKFVANPPTVTIVNEKINITTDGYYAMPNEWFEIGGKGYRLYLAESTTNAISIEDIIANGDTSGAKLVTKQYKLNANNLNVMGSNNSAAGNNSITAGLDNISSGDNGITLGDSNTNNNSDSVVAGLSNYNQGAQSAIFGAQNSVGENQGFATGYHNTILSKAYFSTATGVGNINQGTATTTMGGYNIAGSQYSVAEGLCNIAGGDVTYEGKHLMDIPSYSKTTDYNAGDMCKRNGYVYRALTDIIAGEYIPNPIKYLDKWGIIQPVISESPATASHAGGVNCIAKHHGAFVHGYRLRSGRDYQTFVGKYNVPNTNTLFGVGNGSDTAASNAFEVKNNGSSEFGGDIVLNKKSAANKTITMSQNGVSQLELKANTSSQSVISGRNGIYLRPYFLNGSSKVGAIKLDSNQVIPETSGVVNLGSLGNKFNSLYISGTIYTNNIAIPDGKSTPRSLSSIITKTDKVDEIEATLDANNSAISTMQATLSTKANSSDIPIFTLDGTTLIITTNQ